MPLQLTGKLYIDGQWTQGDSTPFYSIDPGTDARIGKVFSASCQQVVQAVVSAEKAWYSWKEHPFEKKVDILTRFAELVATHKTELATLISQEMGKPLWDSLSEVEAMQKKVSISVQAHLERCPTKTYRNLHIGHRSFGAVAVLGPYNFPAHLPHGQIIPALLAGNTIVFKPSEITPFVAEACVQLWLAAGLPQDVIQLVQGGGEVGSTLIDCPELKGVYFTGSNETGKAIEAHALQFPHRIVALEMGGNNPLIVSKVDNIEAAVFITIQSAFITSGQRCSAARRLILIGEQDAFIQMLIEKTQTLRLGHYTAHPQPYLGPLATKQIAHRVFAAYQAINTQKILLPMELLHQERSFVTPALLDVTGCTNDDKEIFGPLLMISTVSTLQEAIVAANNTHFGLTAGIITDNQREAHFALQHLEAGIINCNAPTTGSSSMASFGGIKDSGNCRPAGYYACDFASYPVASVINEKPYIPHELPAGLQNI